MSRRPEDERVKIPALVHFTRLGYEYVSLKAGYSYDTDTNIFVEPFLNAINRINRLELSLKEAEAIISDLKNILNADDLGRGFYSLLQKGYKGIRLIDFANLDRNTYQVVTELPCRNGNDEFRPDITVLINGMPLAFVEVKRPNNTNGIQAEYERMNARSANKKFRRFINMTQLMVFSNNNEYDDQEPVPLQGAFYATSGYGKLFFSHFREEDPSILTYISDIDPEKENAILKDTNLATLKFAPEYTTNTQPTTPTNRLITSLFSRERLSMLLRYAIAYVEKTDKNGITHLEKHIMRYPQLFATKAIEAKLNSGIKNGIIWHTQGSGKTALAYYNVRYLRDYYQKQGVIAKLYFIVDRLDLLEQAAGEFRARGLHVDEVNSKEAFIRNIGSTGVDNATGEDTITVVNIQKFSEESIAKQSDYDVSVQRVYFLDEAHRSYNPKGSFLANLIASDRSAVMIALTGTPLIGDGYNTKDIFGNYIHKYYYNRSIADRYTLRLIREGIKTEYRVKLQGVLETIKTLEGSLKRKDVYAHEKFVKDLVAYIVEDFRKSRVAINDRTIGGMIVCDSSEQAKAVYEQIQEYPYTAALILHDVDDKETRKRRREEFKDGSIDFLIVYNMLLTGFDASRLKKLYIGRVIKDHGLLQALTRVNRPYGKHRFGYVVDFADIRKEFDKTNKAYFEELQAELGDEFEKYRDIFMTPEEIDSTLQHIRDTLFLYETGNISEFTNQISAIEDKEELLKLHAALEQYKELHNLAKLFGYDDLAESFSMENAASLATEVNNRIAIINLKNNLQNAEDMTAILNMAMDEIDFRFKKISESEMVIADAFRDSLEKTRREISRGQDQQDPEYITLLEELQRLFKKKNIEELDASEMQGYMAELERIHKAAERMNLRDTMLTNKYENDPKFMRIHKRLRESPPPLGTDTQLFPVLLSLKHIADEKVLSNSRMLANEPYFIRDMLPSIKQALVAHNLPFTAAQIKMVGQTLSSEYFHERNWAH